MNRRQTLLLLLPLLATAVTAGATAIGDSGDRPCVPGSGCCKASAGSPAVATAATAETAAPASACCTVTAGCPAGCCQ